jgi:uncharacterized protein (TIGR02284 family)
MENDKVVDVLNDLIETCRDGEMGFQEASENVKDRDLKRFFADTAQQRAAFAGEVQEHVRALGGDPSKRGSVAGSMHRAWMSIKGTLSGKDDQGILNEAERGEDSAVKAYEEALQQDLPQAVQRLLDVQYREILRVHSLVRQLRDSRAARASQRSS